jgi:hypothetical protein
MAVDAHFGRELRHVLALYFVALLLSETRDGEWVTNSRSPEALEANVRLFPRQVCFAKAMLECLSLGKSKCVFVVVVSIGCQAYAKGARSFVWFNGSDGDRRGRAVAGGQ